MEDAFKSAVDGAYRAMEEAMNVSVGGTGTSVVNMRAFDPDIVGSIFTRVDVNWSKDARAKFVVSSLGGLSLIRSTHCATNSKSRRLARHMNDCDEGHYFACLPLKGGVEISHFSGHGEVKNECRIANGQLAMLDTNQEYEIAMSDTLDAIWLRVPGKLLKSHAISVDNVLGRPLDAKNGLGFVAKQMMYGVVTDDTVLTDRGARIFSQSLLSFLGEVINSNLGMDQKAASRGRQKILKRAQDFIEDHIYDEDLNPQLIAQGIGISARYLSELFAAEGTSPMRWVRKRRLEMCRMELERRGGGNQLICEIAYSMGFTNVSSFNRAFKAHFGHSPRDLLAKNAIKGHRIN